MNVKIKMFKYVFLLVCYLLISGCSTTFNSLGKSESGDIEIISASKEEVMPAAYQAISSEFPSVVINELSGYQSGFAWSYRPFLDRTSYKFTFSSVIGETDKGNKVQGIGYSIVSSGTQGLVHARYVEPVLTSFNNILKERGVKKIKIRKVLSSRGGFSKSSIKRKSSNSGTGFVISENGLIVTSEHVIKDAKNIEIVLRNGSKLKAVVLNKDPINDVAILKVDLKSSYLKLISSRSKNKGDEVFTLGYPLVSLQGQEQKATFGRINALSGVKGDVRYMQVDVPIQPGNSGGPLIDSNGNVVGVITSMLHQMNTLRATGVLPQNVNYTVKSDYIIPLLPEYIQLEKVHTKSKNIKMSDLIKVVEDSVVLIYAK